MVEHLHRVSFSAERTPRVEMLDGACEQCFYEEPSIHACFDMYPHLHKDVYTCVCVDMCMSICVDSESTCINYQQTLVLSKL